MWTEESGPNPPESYAVLVPLVASECITFPPYIGLDLTPKLVWDATAGSLHGPENKRIDERTKGTLIGMHKIKAC